jgi:phage baseplate assembly protein gpV
VVGVIGTTLDDRDQTGRAWVRVAFPWHDPGDGIWCPVAQVTASKPGRGAVEVPAAGEAVVALLDPTGFDPPTVLGAVYRGPGGGQPTTGNRRILHASPGIRVEVDQEAGTVTVQGKAIHLLGPVTISETLDVKKGGKK